MKLSANETRVISFCGKTNWKGFDYKLLDSSITRTDCMRELEVFINAKFNFHQQVDNIFSQAIRMLELIRTVTFFFSSLHALLTLYCTLIRHKLKYGSDVWNSITSSDAGMLERIQQQLVSLCLHRFSSH